MRANGNCYRNAFERLLYDGDGWTLVHGEVTGTGGFAKDKRFGHAWLEREEEVPGGTWLRVSDHSNGREVEMPAAMYYGIGNILDEPGKLYRYTKEEALTLSLSTGHYGSWELEIEGN